MSLLVVKKNQHLLTVVIQQLFDDAQYGTKNYAVRGGPYWSIVQNCAKQPVFLCRSRTRERAHERSENACDARALRAKTSFDGNKPFAASYSCGAKPPCWKAKVALGQAKQRKLPFQVMNVFCLSCPCTTFALQRGGFLPR